MHRAVEWFVVAAGPRDGVVEHRHDWTVPSARKPLAISAQNWSAECEPIVRCSLIAKLEH